MTADASAARRHDTRRGIILICFCFICFGFLDASVKVLAETYDVIQIIWARYTFHGLIFLAIFSRLPMRRLFATRHLGLQLARSCLMLLGAILFFNALRFLPLAEAISISFVAPLIVTALSIPILGEKVGIRRWSAIIVGFLGVLVIIRPGAGVIHWAAVLSLGMAVCFAFYQILTRIVGRDDDARTSLFYTWTVPVVATTLALPFVWQPPDLFGWCLMIGAGFFGGFGHFLLIKAYEHGPASLLAPFAYSQLIWMTLLGFVIFGDLPDHWTIVGAAIVIGSGLYMFHREAKRAAGEAD
ncbi:MAG: DMT family transporter [Alphaproteobacteria bacterium]|nr:DMT family transporter [Alphaproteobacteria bacterium]